MRLDSGEFTGIMDKVLSLNIGILNRLTGPILERELRACSRRKRYYLLRVIFIVLLLLLIAWSWLMATSLSMASGSAAFTAMRMSLVSRSVVTAVIGMEFVALPLLATVMMSDSISREINKRTLEILLSTPITSLQIVMGKLFGGLLMLLLLAGITLPLFGIIRVFGGVPWDYVVVSLCITLTATCLFAAMSLFFSIRFRRSYQVVVLVLLTAVLIFGLLPGSVAALNDLQPRPWLSTTAGLLETINPFIGMSKITTSVMNSDPQGVSVFAWGRHCLIVGAMFLLIVLLSTLRLRKTMLALSTGQRAGRAAVKNIRSVFSKNKHTAVSDREIVTVQGDPVLWKEMRIGESKQLMSPTARKIVWFAFIGVVYICAGFFGVLTEPVFHAVFVTILAFIGFLRTAILSALSVSKEKQSRSWPILLTTPLDEGDILKMKAKAIIRKTAAFWIVIFGDVVVFSACLVLNPIALIGVPAAIIPTVLFLIGVGAYFGMRLKTTTGTIAATFAIPITLWMLCPCASNFSPLAMIAMSVGIGTQGEEWLFSVIMIVSSLIPAVVYGVAGFVFLVLAKSSLRKYVFNVSG